MPPSAAPLASFPSRRRPSLDEAGCQRGANTIRRDDSRQHTATGPTRISAKPFLGVLVGSESRLFPVLTAPQDGGALHGRR
jgi:hypothetical protein